MCLSLPTFRRYNSDSVSGTDYPPVPSESSVVLRRNPPQSLPNFIAACQEGLIECAVLAGFQVFFELFEARGAQDDRVYLRLAEQPLK